VAKLRHPNIVTIYETGVVEGQLYIAMAYLPGRTLQTLLAEKGQLALAEALPILEQVASALDYAHEQDLVHRDVKPANVIVEGSGCEVQAVLTDFGLVRALATSSVLTSQGTLLGSPEYMAPEQADPERALDVGPEADRYAFGIVTYQILTGRVPFPGNTPATLNAHEHKPVPPPKDLCPDLPEPVAVALLTMLSKAPEARFPSAKEFVTALRDAHEQAQQAAVFAALYEAFQDAEQEARWADVLKLGGQILAAHPDDQGVSRSMAQAQAHLSGKPVHTLFWGWLVGGIAVLVLLFVGLGNGDWWDIGNEPLALALPSPVSPTETVILTLTPVATPTLVLAAGDTRVRPADEMTMVYVPAGQFMMGSSEGDADEQPVHTVALNAFWMDQTEVSNVQFTDFLMDQGNQVAADGSSWFYLTDAAAKITVEPTTGGPDTPAVYQPEEGYGQHPVVAVSWHGAAAYCVWVGGRLPTEAEWEYAARGQSSLLYPWGDAFACARCNGAEESCDGYAETAPVGSFPEGVSWCGVLDLAGNVWEWVGDWYAEDYYASSDPQNPFGPELGTSRGVRGGSWKSDAPRVRSSSRFRHVPSYIEDGLGFRCVLESLE